MSSETLTINQIGSMRKALCFVEMYILYFLIAIRLKRYGLKKSVALCTQQRPFTGVPNQMPISQFVAFTRDLARSVLKWHLLTNSCVPDSLLPCWFLGRRGIKAEFEIVVRQFPFMAHAQAFWQELPLTDPPPEWSIPGKFVTIMRK